MAERPDAVIHLAALKSVTESVYDPASYYEVNVGGTATLLKLMARHNTPKLVFASSCAVYGSLGGPAHEENAGKPESPYGRATLAAEQLIQQAVEAQCTLQATTLRYFNVVGAAMDCEVGDRSDSSVLGHMFKAAVDGSDFELREDLLSRNSVRDYIHVEDVARVTVDAAARQIPNPRRYDVFNIGRGRPVSTFELLCSAREACRRPIGCKLGELGKGEALAIWADVTAARQQLGLADPYALSEIVHSAWAWYRRRHKL